MNPSSRCQVAPRDIPQSAPVLTIVKLAATSPALEVTISMAKRQTDQEQGSLIRGHICQSTSHHTTLNAGLTALTSMGHPSWLLSVNPTGRDCSAPWAPFPLASGASCRGRWFGQCCSPALEETWSTQMSPSHSLSHCAAATRFAGVDPTPSSREDT